MPHSIFDCLYLLLGTSRLAVVQSLGLIIILTLYDPMLFLCLRCLASVPFLINFLFKII